MLIESGTRLIEIGGANNDHTVHGLSQGLSQCFADQRVIVGNDDCECRFCAGLTCSRHGC